VARRFAAGPPPPRTIIFAAWSGEEAGLLGARHFVQNPVPVPVSGLVGVINIDTVGSLGDLPVSVLATDSAREWPFVFSGITAVTGVPTRSIAGASQSSDQQAFIDVGVPGVQLFTAATGNYHQPTDTADTVDAAGLAKVAVVATEAVSYLASTDKRPTATGKGVGAGGEVGRSERRRVTLGAVPEFGYAGPGIRVDGVVEGSPAAQAGIQKGDVIIALGGQPVPDLNGFTALLRNYQAGDRTVVRWKRGDAEQEREVELAPR
jgi:membrane-associated protease RseP (regulator of RpoE activity)